MRRFASLAVLGAMVVAMVGGTARAVPMPGCSTSGFTTISANSATPGTVDPGKVAKFKLSLSSGQIAELVNISAGDTDLQVCYGGKVVCSSTNAAGVPDACADEGLESAQGFGPQLSGAGTYYITINHCTAADCGYPADVPAPIAFVLTNVVI